MLLILTLFTQALGMDVRSCDDEFNWFGNKGDSAKKVYKNTGKTEVIKPKPVGKASHALPAALEKNHVKYLVVQGKSTVKALDNSLHTSYVLFKKEGDVVTKLEHDFFNSNILKKLVEDMSKDIETAIAYYDEIPVDEFGAQLQKFSPSENDWRFNPNALYRIYEGKKPRRFVIYRRGTNKKIEKIGDEAYLDDALEILLSDLEKLAKREVFFLDENAFEGSKNIKGVVEGFGEYSAELSF